MARVQVGDVLAVGVVLLVGRPVPDDAEPGRRRRPRPRQPTEKPELQVVTQVARITILHPSTMPARPVRGDDPGPGAGHLDRSSSQPDVSPAHAELCAAVIPAGQIRRLPRARAVRRPARTRRPCPQAPGWGTSPSARLAPPPGTARVLPLPEGRVFRVRRRL